MKKIVCLMLAAVTAVSLAGCGKSSDDNKLIVGTEAGFAPYEYMEGDKVVGIDMDIAQAIADAMDKELVIKNMEFQGALAAVQSGKVDFVAAGVSVDEDRKKKMDFSHEYVSSTEVVVVNKDASNVTGIKDLNDKIIGVQEGNIADFYISNPDNVTTDSKNIKRYSKFVQAAEDLKNNKIDCIVMDQYPAQELVAANDSLVILKKSDGTDDVLFEDKYAIAVKKGNTELLNKINEVIDQLIKDGKIEEFTAKHTKTGSK
ncbi:transporter substrate-binding domain-containing protein [Anaerocolumna xylanovorans]|uniref:Polar amino acid transport system substrate-binding protein n=1 Tax=Anaerocolumna xylanovorans DSM 12503 TaxID=1121345 RepID=A0A1M7YFD1_9FIRM|nr:transporter substrate-binding domain-containing protein [Anaerocolumna xylanovorans]SHO51330.1 polar amino acid transport system substrate-binding protein [Anaerocolumna xylanovorans DSM 12503]